MAWSSCASAGENSRPVSRTIMRPCSSRSQPVLTHGYSEKPVFTSLPGVPQMRCLLVWGQRDDPLAGQLTLHAARVSGAHCSDRPASS